MKESVVVGIDPGQNGAIAVLSEDGDILEFVQFQGIDDPEDIDVKIKELIEKYHFWLVGLELVNTMPGQGIASSGKFMEIKGMIKGVLAANEIKFVEITPQKWRKLSPILKAKPGDNKQDVKKKSLEFVKTRWKDFSDIKFLVKDIDLCDAICIAEYLRIFFLGRIKADLNKNAKLEEAREWMAKVKEKQKLDRIKRTQIKKKK